MSEAEANMRRSFDVVIVGGGVIGSSIAYFLAESSDFTGSIAVIERDSTYAIASSSLSSSSIRQQFGTVPNIAMSAWSIEFLRQARAHLSVPDNVADIGLREPGYLFLGGPGSEGYFRAKHEIQRSAGVPSLLLTPDDLRERYPDLNADDVAIASVGLEKEGWFDGPGLHQAFRRKARSLGVTYINGEVSGLDRVGSRIGAVVMADGQRISCDTVVGAAGCWSGIIGRMAGIEVPVVPRKRCTFVLDSPANTPAGHFLHDTTGVWIRPEGHLFICGTTPAHENEADDFTLEVDYDLFDDEIWPALAHRMPGFERLRMLRAWAGLYEYNLFDHSAIIGRHPEIANFVLCTGFSGHGMMHSPAAGQGVADLITFGEYRQIDLTEFGIERIAANRPIPEHVY
ncbi:FAD-binding oxidoreductase [Bosea vestrisii]|uniref:NAD(P)/FAD-dependent oxidoreductase n=1 Tax=Bosea vestrisii TaxID=151416 RepID=UPI0024DF87A2|nr:FAD-binding oxidoreductase [Bosea vestrisii]WID95211.1 FAD-binding oxidoreductase [Bosea vestrisii]